MTRLIGMILCSVFLIGATASHASVKTFYKKHVSRFLPGETARKTKKALTRLEATVELKGTIAAIKILHSKIIGSKSPEKGELSQSSLWAHKSPLMLLFISESKAAIVESEKEKGALFDKFAHEITQKIKKIEIEKTLIEKAIETKKAEEDALPYFYQWGVSVVKTMAEFGNTAQGYLDQMNKDTFDKKIEALQHLNEKLQKVETAMEKHSKEIDGIKADPEYRIHMQEINQQIKKTLVSITRMQSKIDHIFLPLVETYGKDAEALTEKRVQLLKLSKCKSEKDNALQACIDSDLAIIISGAKRVPSCTKLTSTSSLSAVYQCHADYLFRTLCKGKTEQECDLKKFISLQKKQKKLLKLHDPVINEACKIDKNGGKGLTKSSDPSIVNMCISAGAA